MDLDAALHLTDMLVFKVSETHLTDLQQTIVRQVWQGKRYSDIAQRYGCTEGHAKDVGADLWAMLSKATGERVTKTSLQAVINRYEARQFGKQPSPSMASTPPIFVGRGQAFDDLDQLIQQGHRFIAIQGEGGLGKTTLAQHYLQQNHFEIILELMMARDPSDTTPVEQIVEEWFRQELQEEPGQTFGIMLRRLKSQLQLRRIGILIDNLESILDHQGRCCSLHQRYAELFRMLGTADGHSVILLTSRDRLCDPMINVKHYRLSGLTLQDWQHYFELGSIQVDQASLTALHSTYGGNAKAMRILGGLIVEDFGGDAATYWLTYGQDPLSVTDLKHLIADQFNRLFQLDPQAYQLLCCLGCYRYQDHPTLPIEAILSLDLDLRPLIALRDRSLVECIQGEYSLHPAIRAEAQMRLKSTPLWAETHYKAAQYWTQSVTQITSVPEAISALEAFYHYVTVGDREAAAQVLLQPRANQWGQFLPLASTLYRMGLVQPALMATQQVIHQIAPTPQQGELFNLLGDLYWISGDLQQAIQCQHQAISTAQASVQPGISAAKLYYLNRLIIDSRLSLGLYYIDQWELTEAAMLLEMVISEARDTPHTRWAEKATVGLALVQAYRGKTVTAKQLADQVYPILQTRQPTGQFSFFLQLLGQAYVQLSELQLAEDLCQQAITASELGHYPQVKAKALNTLAMIYRSQQAYEVSQEYHTQAIHLLDQIGAQCDLAEAYFQRGLTYWHHYAYPQAYDDCQQAILLFQAIHTPKQIQKVKAVLDQIQPVNL